MILISGGDEERGASPRSSIRYAGLPWELGLSETHQTLMLNNLRSRVRLQTTARCVPDVMWLLPLIGAEEYGFCSAVLVVVGCVMLRHCHLNIVRGRSHAGRILEKRFRGRPEFIVIISVLWPRNYARSWPALGSDYQ